MVRRSKVFPRAGQLVLVNGSYGRREVVEFTLTRSEPPRRRDMEQVLFTAAAIGGK